MWGGTQACIFYCWSRFHFNPPTPCGVGHHCQGFAAKTRYFNPPTPCGVGLTDMTRRKQPTDISIHPPRVGWDASIQRKRAIAVPFQSTHPVWGGTGYYWIAACGNQFQSTHPVWGGTAVGGRRKGGRCNFNPPTPCGVGQQKFTKQAVELLRK